MANFYQKHVFFCTNRKTNGKKCCAEGDSERLAEFAKQQLRQRELFGEGKIRVSKSACLGRCQQGPCMVIYPEGTWYTYQNEADILSIIEQHCVNNQLVTRLLIAEPDIIN